MGKQRICRARIVILKTDVGPCTEPTIDPKAPYCYWHRLDRTTLPGQARAAEMRLAAAPTPHRSRVPPQEWPAGSRWCAGCQSMVPIWYCTGSKCKACSRAAQQAARRRDVYGLSDEAWQAIMELQGGRCAICRNHSRDRAPAVEHDHQTSAVRGGACKHCNHDLLGAAFDSPRMLASALMYLLAPPTSGRWVRPEDGADTILRVVGETLEQLRVAASERRKADAMLSILAAPELHPGETFEIWRHIHGNTVCVHEVQDGICQRTGRKVKRVQVAIPDPDDDDGGDDNSESTVTVLGVDLD